MTALKEYNSSMNSQLQSSRVSVSTFFLKKLYGLKIMVLSFTLFVHVVLQHIMNILVLITCSF
jgi:hypothetical protein